NRRLGENILIPVVCLFSIGTCYILDKNAATWFGGFQIGIELLILNGIITFLGLLMISSRPEVNKK
ncbi:MAG: sodium:solute symporter, partial [Chitinophagaceae bacterium]